ncbi:MAG: phytoene/squalene synthase family protein [Rhizobiaceae bacterium]
MPDLTDDVAAQLRLLDRDRYLSVLYAPAEQRPALSALYAFNAEIASIRDRVSEPLPGEVRLQWWRDVLEAGTEEAAAGHPLATALVRAIHTHKLPLAAFQNMLDARIFDLYDDPMPTRTDLEGYCGETASALIQLASLILDRDAAVAAVDLAGHAGCAQAIAGLLRSLPITRARGQCYLPADLLAAAGATPEKFNSGEDGPATERALQAMVALGREHWTAFQRQTTSMPQRLRPAFLPAALAPAYLDAVARQGAGALSRPADIAGWRKQWLMFRAATKGL